MRKKGSGDAAVKRETGEDVDGAVEPAYPRCDGRDGWREGEVKQPAIGGACRGCPGWRRRPEEVLKSIVHAKYCGRGDGRQGEEDRRGEGAAENGWIGAKSHLPFLL